MEAQRQDEWSWVDSEEKEGSRIYHKHLGPIQSKEKKSGKGVSHVDSRR